MELRKIMVATDFSEASETAVEQAMHIARFTGAELVLVHAGNVPNAGAEIPDGLSSLEEFNTLVRETANQDRAQLEALRQRLAGQGVELSHALVDGFPDQAVCETANEIGADLVVTGTHGRTGLKRFLLGSVAERVVRISDRSVLVSRNDEGRGGFGRILVPTDFSPLSLKAVDMAIALAKENAQIDILHCWQLPPASPANRATDAVLNPILKAISSEIKERGNALVESLETKNVTVRFSATREAPAQGIQTRLGEEDYELLILGSHGRRGIRRFLLGSVAEATLRHANCSVLVIHDPSTT
jgi:nucleotide-binding universal stress UspA family protein